MRGGVVMAVTKPSKGRRIDGDKRIKQLIFSGSGAIDIDVGGEKFDPLSIDIILASADSNGEVVNVVRDNAHGATYDKLIFGEGFDGTALLGLTWEESEEIFRDVDVLKINWVNTGAIGWTCILNYYC